ncbi:MAG: HAD family hydrolase, partial [Chloroflexota bacterium]
MLTQNTIRAIVFDLDGTLRINNPGINQTFFKFAEELGLPSTLSQQRSAAQWAHYYWAQSDTLASDLEAMGRDDERFWSNYVKRNLVALGCPEQLVDALAPQMREKMKNQHFDSCLFPDVPGTLENLRDAGYTIGLVSNRRTPIVEELEELGLTPYLDFSYVAGEVDIWKPNPEIFDRAKKETGFSSEEMVYIGDNYYADVVGAQRAGITPILIDPEHVFPDADCVVIRSIGEI